MLGKRHSLFIELCIIELPLSRVLVEFGLNPFRISIKFQPRISKLKICMETTAVEKVLSPFPQALQPPKFAKHTFPQYCGGPAKSATRVLKKWRQISFSALTTSSIL